MIIECNSCQRKFAVKDKDIPKQGRMVQCGYCSVTWHQMPLLIATESPEQLNTDKNKPKINEDLSVDKIKASDGKTYKFLGSQWAEILPSGKTGLFAKRKIGKELDNLTGRKKQVTNEKTKNKIKKKLDPSSEILKDESQLPDIYKPKQGLGFSGYIFLIIIIGFSLIGMLKTFEDDLISSFPEIEYIFYMLNEQLEYLTESVKNIIVLISDIINSY